MFEQEYIRGGRESILLPIAVCKHSLPNTEVKLHYLTHKTYHKRLTYNRVVVLAIKHDSGLVSNDKH